MKYEKFEGSLGEFLEHISRGTLKLYTLDGGHPYEVYSDSVEVLVNCYEEGIYTEKEEVWTDHLPVLCWVTDDIVFEEEVTAIVTEFQDSGWYMVEDHGCNYKYARPVTQEEIDKMIWKK